MAPNILNQSLKTEDKISNKKKLNIKKNFKNFKTSSKGISNMLGMNLLLKQDHYITITKKIIKEFMEVHLKSRLEIYKMKV